MKLLNHTSIYFAVVLFLVITVWALVFYFSMIDEVYEGLDDTLKENAELLVEKTKTDSTLLLTNGFKAETYSFSKVAKGTLVNKKYRNVDMFVPYDGETESMRMHTRVFEHEGQTYRLEIISSLVETDDIAESLLNSLLWLYGALIVLLLLLNNILLKKIWRPFYTTLQKLKDFRIDKPHETTSVKTSIHEFKALDESVNQLLRRNQETFASQKQFIENASHELQTPLAIVLNKLELLVESGNLSPEQLQKISNSIDMLERMGRLNKSLLLLSKIENRQFIPELVNINAEIKKVVSDLQELLDYYEVKLFYSESGDCNVMLHPDLTSILITNLVKNALVHNHKGGEIHIHVAPHAFTIENTGNTKSLQADKLFTRFYKEGRDTTSTGLGLAIIKAILDMSGYEIRYSFNDRHIMQVSFS